MTDISPEGSNALGDTPENEKIQRFRMKANRVAAISIVPKGAAQNSDHYMLQAAPAFVAEKLEEPVEYPIVAMVQEHLEALSEETDRSAAINQILDVLEQGTVTDAITDWRSSYPDSLLWQAFLCAYQQAGDDDDAKLAVIQDFASVLTEELVTNDQGEDANEGENSMTQSEPNAVRRVLATAVRQESPEVTEEMVAEPQVEPQVATEPVVSQESSEEAKPESVALSPGTGISFNPDTEPTNTITQEAVQEIVSLAVSEALKPISETLEQATVTNTELKASLEQAQTDLAKERSKNTPTSAQPDAETTDSLAQGASSKPVDPYANTHMGAYLRQNFPGRGVN